MIFAGRILKITTCAVLLGVVAAISVAWASERAARPSQRAERDAHGRHLSLTCDAGQASVLLRTNEHLRKRSPSGVVRVELEIARPGQRVLVRAHLMVAARSTELTVEKRFGAPGSKRILAFARGTRTCRDGSRDRALSVRIRYMWPASTISAGQRLRSVVVRAHVEVRHTKPSTPRPPNAANGPSGTSSSEPESSPSPPQPDHCQSLVERTPPIVDIADLNEASGLAFSRTYSGLLWTHNDSGGNAELFAIDEDGNLLGRYELPGAINRDWEDIAVGPGSDSQQPYIYVGDIGDNSAARSSITVYRVREPDARPDGSGGTFPAVEQQVLTYPDGARDAETLFVDQSGALYVVTKREAKSRVYRFAGDWDGLPEQLDYMGELAWGGAVGGDMSQSGNLIALKSYLTVYVHERASGQSVWAALSQGGRIAPYVPELQGESIALCGNGGIFLTTSEGVGSPLYAYQG